ncbi:hypothetical protein BaRGS_00010599, partial [Batillaria attramentaria]
MSLNNLYLGGCSSSGFVYPPPGGIPAAAYFPVPVGLAKTLTRDSDCRREAAQPVSRDPVTVGWFSMAGKCCSLRAGGDDKVIYSGPGGRLCCNGACWWRPVCEVRYLTWGVLAGYFSGVSSGDCQRVNGPQAERRVTGGTTPGLPLTVFLLKPRPTQLYPVCPAQCQLWLAS